MCCQVRGVLDRTICDRSLSSMRSILGVTFGRISTSASCTFNCRRCIRPHCDRSQITASEFPRRKSKSDESKGRLGRRGKCGSIWLRSIVTIMLERIVLDCINCSRLHCQWSRVQSLLNFSPLSHKLHQ